MSWLLSLLFLPFRLLPWLLRRLLYRFRPVTVLSIRLRGALPDMAPKGRLGTLLSGTQAGVPLFGLLTALRLAERDTRLRTVVVRIAEFQAGLARAEEVRAALQRVVAAGKRVVVYAEDLSLAGYWVALGASEIVLAPTGGLNLVGIRSEIVLLKGMLDKVGLRAQLSARGKYKSMRETFAADEVSEANREMMDSLVADLYEQLAARVSEGRQLPVPEVKALIDLGPFRASEAAQRGLIDRPLYFDELEEELKAEPGFRPLRTLAYTKLKTRSLFPVRAPRVALLSVGGNIKSGDDSMGPGNRQATGSDSFVKAVQAAASNRRVKAILLRVDSPGGSALASDVMWRALGKASENKPLFVSMVNVAASGGYYVSGILGAKIWASANTITGSIGAVAGKFEFSGLYEKLGIRREAIGRGAHSGYYATSSAWSESELQKLETDLDAIYDDFVSKMAAGRELSKEQLHEVAQGRVWTGQQAKERGLVDHLGGAADVLSALRQQLGLSEVQPLTLVHANQVSAATLLKRRLRPELFLPEPLLEAQALVEHFSAERHFCRLPWQLKLY